jgi:hypothetical protein
MEHDREEADNDKEGEEVSGRKEKYQPHPSPQKIDLLPELLEHD